MTASFSRLVSWLSRHGSLAAFGELERRVLEALWRRHAASSVRDLAGDFPGSAYTTIMTTLDRLYRKGVLERSKSGRAYRYRARYGREELEALLAAGAIQKLLSHTPGALRPALSFLVDAAGRADDRVLDELEALLRKRSGRDGGDQ